jgi:hypothetical protein
MAYRRLAGRVSLAAALLASAWGCAARRIEVGLAPLPADRAVLVSAKDLSGFVAPERTLALHPVVVKRLYRDGSYELIGLLRSNRDDLFEYSTVKVEKSAHLAAGDYLGERKRFRADAERATGASPIDLDRHVDWADDAAFEELDRDGRQWGLLFFGRKSAKLLIIMLGGVPELGHAAFERIVHKKMLQLEQYEPRAS